MTQNQQSQKRDVLTKYFLVVLALVYFIYASKSQCQSNKMLFSFLFTKTAAQRAQGISKGAFCFIAAERLWALRSIQTQTTTENFYCYRCCIEAKKNDKNKKVKHRWVQKVKRKNFFPITFSIVVADRTEIFLIFGFFDAKKRYDRCCLLHWLPGVNVCETKKIRVSSKC